VALRAFHINKILETYFDIQSLAVPQRYLEDSSHNFYSFQIDTNL